MIKIVAFSGGLGNQMFQYAFYRALRKRYPFSLYAFDIRESKGCHNGFELFRLFLCHNKRNCLLFSFLNRILKQSLSKKFVLIKQIDSITFDPTDLQPQAKSCIYEGYWQSQYYFENVIPEVRRCFKFKESLLNIRTVQLAGMLLKENWCSIHIRRGDYLSESLVGICPLDYYQKAITYVVENTGCCKFCIFSDDIQWVKANLPISDAIYVDWNVKSDSWQDMYLMSKCKHNIIANSTFSWWGAWLNGYEHKLVIAPKQWFVAQNQCDIIPSEWVVL